MNVCVNPPVLSQINFILCVTVCYFSLSGMLLMGFALRNIPVINVAEDIDPVWSSALRSASVVHVDC